MTIKNTLVIVLLLTPFASMADKAEQLFTVQPSVTPELAIAGEHSVGVKTIEIINPQQRSAADFTQLADRALTLEVWYPTDGDTETSAIYQDETRSGISFAVEGSANRDAVIKQGERWPLVVLSHGYTGYRSQFFPIGEHLASHGFIVASIDHTDSTNKEIDFDKAPGAGFMSTLMNRARDQQAVLELLTNDVSDWSSSIDPARAAVIGFSMGGFGVLNTVGGCYDFPDAFVAGFGLQEDQVKATQQLLNICSAGKDKADPRWKAAIAIAPWGGEQYVHANAALNELTVPMLYIAGEHDDVSGYENGVARLYEETGSPSKYMLVYENARHNLAVHPAPKAAYGNDLDLGHYFEPAWNTETMVRINNHMILAFLDCHLMESSEACAFLPPQGSATQTKQADGSMSDGWPGFKPRWATGLRFYRGDQ